jgi:hypothetical protein
MVVYRGCMKDAAREITPSQVHALGFPCTCPSYIEPRTIAARVRVRNLERVCAGS